MIAPEKIIDRLPLSSRRYFAVFGPQMRTVIEGWMLKQKTKKASLSFIQFDKWDNVPTEHAAALARHTNLLADAMGGVIVHHKRSAKPSAKSMASQLLQRIQRAHDFIEADSPADAWGLIPSNEKLTDVFFRLERQFMVAIRNGHETEKQKGEALQLYGLIGTFMEALTEAKTPGLTFRVLVVPQAYRDVAVLSAKLVVAAGQLLPPEHELAAALEQLNPGVITFPDPLNQKSSSNIHLVSAHESHLPTWDPYDQLAYFLMKVRPDFDALQEAAVPQVLKVLDGLEFSHVLDIGCGSGRVLREISHKLRCPGIGIDCSPTQINEAKRANNAAHLSFEECSFPQVRTFSPTTLDSDFRPIAELFEKQSKLHPAVDAESKCVLFLGNTLPHLGARALRAWLHYLQRKGRLPKYIVFDFLTDWIAALYGLHGAVQVGIPQKNHKTLPDCDGLMVTVLAPPQITRGVILTSKTAQEPTRQRIVDYCMVPQHADTPETYKDLLRSWGYKVDLAPSYQSGWGDHEVYIARLGDLALQTKFPGPDDGTNKTINQAWYRFLKQLWQRAFANDGAAAGSCLKTIVLIPNAILPFEAGRVWARYVSRESDGADAESSQELFKTWMWVLDPSRITSNGMTAAKPESHPPYAPGIYSAMLADVPTAIVNHVVDINPPYDLNSADLRLSEMERVWLKETLPNDPAEYRYFAVPIFRYGFPLFCVIAAVPIGGWTLSLLHQLLATEKQRIEDRIDAVWSDDEYTAFALRGLNALGNAKKAKELPQVALNERKWTSWLETSPGTSHLESDTAQKQIAVFKERHNAIIDELTKEPFMQISIRLRGAAFFTSTIGKKGTRACGHEHFTDRHRRAASELAKDISGLFPPRDLARGSAAIGPTPGSALFRHAEAFLVKFSKFKERLPAGDEDEVPRSSPYKTINWEFQKFKALFCRTAENTENDYRVSPMMIIASADFYHKDFGDGKLKLNGVAIQKVFDSEVHAKPKLGMEDTWLKLSAFWKCVVPKFINEVNVSSDSVGELSITVRFATVISRRSGGSSLNEMIQNLNSLGQLEGKPPTRISGFKTVLRENEENVAIISTFLTP